MPSPLWQPKQSFNDILTMGIGLVEESIKRHGGLRNWRNSEGASQEIA